MPSFRHILFPADFSPQMDAVIPYVAAYARQFESKVTLLSVVPPIWAGRGVEPVVAADAEAGAEKRMTPASKLAVCGLAVEHVVRRGEASEQIAAFARDAAADLIMMPTHGYGRFRSALIGSVTAKVLHDAVCPVWTSAHALEQHARQIPATIVCASPKADLAATCRCAHAHSWRREA